MAEALFQEARRLIEAGDWAAACPKLAASVKLDPTANGTRLNLARCYATTGRVASAWTVAKETLAEARRISDPKRATAAQEILAQVEPALPKLTVKVPQANAVSGLSVQCDGNRVDNAAWGVAIPVDPGEHVVSADAPDKAHWSSTVRIAPRQVLEVSIPALGDARAAPPPPPASAPESRNTRRVVAVAVAGVGVIGLGVGAAFGLLARSSWSDAEAHCDASFVCNASGHRSAETASSRALVATVGLLGGGALVATGAVLWLTAPSDRRAHPKEHGVRILPVLTAQGGSLVLVGAFQ